MAMKKFLYLCGMMLMTTNMMAQIDPNDRNWVVVLEENFDEDASYWEWNRLSFANPSNTWRAYPGSGVTHASEHQVYQPSQCQIDVTNQQMKLVAEYDSQGRIGSNDYDLPPWMWETYGGEGYPSSEGLFYFSGEMDYVGATPPLVSPDPGAFRYGYFEIRCKLPTHQGAFPAFWLFGASKDTADPYYEEIDIFEYSWALGDPNAHWLIFDNPCPTGPGDKRIYSTAICHNLLGDTLIPDTDGYGLKYVRIQDNHEDIGGWHTYSCEWMPDHVYWYFDGELVNTYHDKTHIPKHHLTLKTNYAIDDYYYHGGNTWLDSDTMAIDYIRVRQLGWDCGTDEAIACQSDLDGFDYKVKKSVAITSALEEVVVGNADKITFRVADSFEITGPFQVNSGCEFTVIRQDCPE